MVECCKNIGKCLFFIFNTVFWVVGIAFMAIGIAVLAPGKFHDVIGELGHETMKISGIVLVTVGTTSFIAGFAGCCGAIRESRALLSIYIFFLSIILLMEVATGCFMLAKHNKVRKYLLDKFSKIKDVKSTSKEAGGLKSIQSMFKCCGFTRGCKDWYKNEAYQCSCASGSDCKVYDKKECVNMDNKAKGMYTKPCYEKSVEYLESHMASIGGAIVGVAVAELLGLVLAIILCRSMKDGQYEAY